MLFPPRTPTPHSGVSVPTTERCTFVRLCGETSRFCFGKHWLLRHKDRFPYIVSEAEVL